MAYFGNTSSHLLESLQGVGRTLPDLRKVRVGHRDWQIFIRISVKISNFFWCKKLQKLSIFLLFCINTQNVVVKQPVMF